MPDNVTVKKTVEIGVEFSPGELGKIFAQLDGEQMAEFFNAVAAEAATWKNSFCFQMQYLTDTKNLNKEARAIMRTIGEYSEPSND